MGTALLLLSVFNRKVQGGAIVKTPGPHVVKVIP